MTRSFIKVFSIIVFLFYFSGCHTNKKEAPSAVAYPEWAKNSVIYEINTRQYSPQGTFKVLQADLPRIKDLGVDILWLMPIYPIGVVDRKAPPGATTSLGSYYSVKDYQAVNPEFGTDNDFKSFVDQAHRMGFKVILDWVANHTARDHNWITEHSDWYKKDAHGTIATPYDWTDCAQLDYSKKDLRSEMIRAMKYWVTQFDIDGFRCDMAGLVPTDFWEEARGELEKTKHLFMLAEDEDKPALCQIAFDANYGWKMHHLIEAVTKMKERADAILKLQSSIDSVMPPRAFKLNFITNHDENSWNGTAKEKFGAGEKCAAVLTYTLPGMPLIYNGQEAAMTKRLSFFTKDTIDWSDTQMVPFYQKLNQLKHRNSAIWAPPYGGTLTPLSNSASDKVISFLRSDDNSKVLVLLNMSSDTITVDITSVQADGKYTNIINQNKIDFNKENRVCYFEPWEYLILEGDSVH